MICLVCRQRWADFPEGDFEFVGPHGKLKMFFSRITLNLIKRNGLYPKHEEAKARRIKAFMSDEIKCCRNPDCREIVCNMINDLPRTFVEPYDALVEETKKELAEGKIK